MVWKFDITVYIAASNEVIMPYLFLMLSVGFTADADIWSDGRVSAVVFGGRIGLSPVVKRVFCASGAIGWADGKP